MNFTGNKHFAFIALISIALWLLTIDKGYAQGELPQQNSQTVQYDTIHMLTYKRIFSKNYTGWKISYTEFTGNTNDFVMPLTFSFNSYRISPKLLEKSNIKSLKNYALGLGFDGYQKLFNGFYLKLGIDVPLGIEVSKNVEDKKTHRFLIGGTPRLGFTVIPWKELGIILGGSVFGQLSTSKTMHKEFGFELEAGINF